MNVLKATLPEARIRPVRPERNAPNVSEAEAAAGRGFAPYPFDNPLPMRLAQSDELRRPTWVAEGFVAAITAEVEAVVLAIADAVVVAVVVAVAASWSIWLICWYMEMVVLAGCGKR